MTDFRIESKSSGGGGSGTVTTVSVVSANGISGSVSNPASTPAITLSLAAITPTTVNGVVLSGSSTPTLAVTGTTTLSGANTGDQIFKTNGTNNGSQTILNLKAGTNITLTDNGTGQITIDASGGGSSLSLEIDGTPNTVQTLLNLISGTNIILTDDGLGGVNISLTGAGGINLQDSGNTYFQASAGSFIFKNGADTTLNITASGGLQLNNGSGFQLLQVSTSGLNLYNSSSFFLMSVSTSGMTLYNSGSFQLLSVSASSGLSLYNSSSFNLLQVSTSGMNLYANSSALNTMQVSDSGLNLYNSGTNTFSISTSGFTAYNAGTTYLQASNGVLTVSESGTPSFGISSGGIVTAVSLDTGGTPPTPSGVTANVITDASGQLSFTVAGSVVGNDRQTALTAAQALATYTVGASDGSFVVSANVLITTSTLHSFSVRCSYTDESNTARVLTLNFSQLTGAFVTTLTNALGASAYEGVPVHIRAKAGTTIIISSAGTFTTVTYNLDEIITQYK